MRNRKVEQRLKKAIVSPDMTIRESISAMQNVGVGILLVCIEKRKLIGVVTDGDIRRAMLRNIPFDNAISVICNKEPIIAEFPVSNNKALELMDCGKKFTINNLPVLNNDGQVVALILRSDLVSVGQLPLSGVVMAGGFGSRLRPLTENIPKPMLRVGNKPILEHILIKLRDSGIHNVKITTHYLSEKIQNYFRDGKEFKMDISYIPEDTALGTAGSIGLLGKVQDPILVINGDVLTNIDFHAMYNVHKKHRATLTVGVSQYEFEVPYGVVKCNGPNILQLQEKPVQQFLINAGVYILDPEVHKCIPKDKYYDMTDLIKQLIEDGKTVINFPIIEYWVDIGQQEDYERVNGEYVRNMEANKHNDRAV